MEPRLRQIDRALEIFRKEAAASVPKRSPAERSLDIIPSEQGRSHNPLVN